MVIQISSKVIVMELIFKKYTLPEILAVNYLSYLSEILTVIFCTPLLRSTPFSENFLVDVFISIYTLPIERLKNKLSYYIVN